MYADRDINVEELLLAKGVKPTVQRVVIADYILRTDTHPTAEEVLDAVADKLPVALSRATVYNTLNLFVAKGVLKEVFTEPGCARFDANTDEHHHFVDVKTGKVFDIPASMVPALAGRLGGNFRVHSYQVTFFGDSGEPEEPGVTEQAGK